MRLLKIPDWDFNWQDVYHYAEPIRLPAGTKLSMTIAYDNSERNPRNPARPPVRVGYGQQTSDEMAEMWFQVLPLRAEDRDVLVASLYRKVLPEEIKGRRAMLARDSSSVALRDDLALLLAESGDLAGAEKEFRATLAQRPGSAAARFNVGMAALGRGDRAEAERYFAAALEADSSHGPSHFQLGLMRQSDGDVAQAAVHLSAAVAARPNDPDVLLTAGVVDATSGNDDQAVRRLRAALDMRPGWANAEAALAAVLSSSATASAAELGEAVRLAERANARTARRNPAFLDILAGSLAAAGDLQGAAAAEREAIRLADAAADAASAARFRARLAQWETPR